MKKNKVVFSGIDGCGKSTQINLLVSHFQAQNVKHKVIWVRPGSTPFILFIKSAARFSLDHYRNRGEVINVKRF